MDRYAGAPTIILVGASGSSTHSGEAQGDQKMRGELPGPAAQLSVDLGNGLPAFVRTSSPSDCYCRIRVAWNGWACRNLYLQIFHVFPMS
jgi:hypothetical protein